MPQDLMEPMRRESIEMTLRYEESFDVASDHLIDVYQRRAAELSANQGGD